MALFVQLVSKHFDVSNRPKTYRRFLNVEYLPKNQLQVHAQPCLSPKSILLPKHMLIDRAIENSVFVVWYFVENFTFLTIFC